MIQILKISDVRKTLLSAIISLGAISPETMAAQDIAIHNNIVYDISKSLSLGTEIALKSRTTLEIYGSVRPWKETSTEINKHWLAQAQYRFYTCQKYNGFYWGPYVHGGEFNVENPDLPFNLLKGIGGARYEGWFVGGGFGIGYEMILTRHFNIGLEIGGGYTYVNYGKYNCGVCGSKTADDNYNYWGMSKLGLNLIYLF